MKSFTFLSLILFLIACTNRKDDADQAVEQSLPLKPGIMTGPADSVLNFDYILGFTHPLIMNASDRQVDLLLNGVEGFLDGKRFGMGPFDTECMVCQSFQEYNGGLLLGKRLFATTSGINYFKKDRDIADTAGHIKKISVYGERKPRSFSFKDGKGNITYQGVSCNDADFYRVSLSFISGNLVIDSLINAGFFEYDLDKDGYPEQYLYGIRNCSQEVVLLRATKKRD